MFKILLMKKLVALFLVCTLFSSCDDGDIYFDSLSFPSNLNISKCATNELYYKAYNSELLAIELLSSGTPILNTSLTIGQLNTITTSSSNTLYYRLYDGAVTAATICGNLPPASPAVVKEYTSKSGATMEYTLNMTVEPSTSQPNRFSISYNYIINFKNLVLVNDQQEEIKYSVFNFGTTATLPENTNTINFDSTNITYCEGNGFYSASNSQLIRFNIPESLPALGNSTTIALNDTNTLNIKTYKEAITSPAGTNYCQNNPDKTVAEDWTARSGSLKITHTEAVENNVNTQVYTFVLETAVFSKATRTFTVTDANLGTYKIVE